MFGYYYDPTYILVIIGAILSMWASAKVNSTFAKYSQVRSSSGITGEETARLLLGRNGINHVSVVHIGGQLTDNYNPSTKKVNLSDPVYGSSSIATVSVAAHECGHAMQHNTNYFPLAFRSALVPVANIGSKIGIPIILIGVLLSYVGRYNYTIIQIGLWCFSLSVLFQIITLPVEFNASKRALAAIQENALLSQEEYRGAKEVLTAAALTYVASAAASILSLLRLVMIFGGGRRRD
ncbi:MAG: zinc metallopeptidase [Lachnospiraceae bacterium]|nr:zinc metallopeptidase [Lachnospiraceae bacterium]